MRKHTPIPVTVLTGYLGSGKTTLVNRLLADPQGMRIAVIVNDIGEINIDAALIAAKGHASVEDTSLVSLTNGCVCCSLSTELVEQIAKLAKMKKFDYILLEASGICEPLPIAQSISLIDGTAQKSKFPTLCRIDGIIAVVDAYRLLTEFSSGEDLLDPDEQDIASLLVQQIEFCNLVLLNKVDQLTEEEAGKVEAIVKALQPKAQIIRTSFVDVPAKDILNIHLYDHENTYLSAGWAQTLEHENDEVDEDDDDDHDDDHEHEEHDHDHEDHDHEHEDHDHEHEDHEHEDHDHEHEDHDRDHEDHEHEDHDHDHDHDEHGHHHHHDHDHGGMRHEDEYGISTFIYTRRQPFIDEDLENWVYHFPPGVIRCKGLVWIDGDDKSSYLLEQSGKSVSVQVFSRWLASVSPKEREEAWRRDPSNRDSWDEKVGDRMTKLVFIGKDMDREAICASLDECLAVVL